MTKDKLISHLARRAGFGLAPGELERFRNLPYPELVSGFLQELHQTPPPLPSDFNPYRSGQVERVLMLRLLSGKARLAEKLALFWHDHFATSNRKVMDRELMWNQYRLFRRFGGGRFSVLVKRVARDVAMLRWLDGNSNRKGQPNENFARELMELFTLGVGHYSERDVKEAARAFTGWSCVNKSFQFQAEHHDTGLKEVLGRKGRWGGDEVIDILCASPACARLLATKLLQHFVHPEPSPAFVERLARVYLENDQRVDHMLKAIFLDPQFQRPESVRVLVKSPIELMATSLRVTGQTELPEHFTQLLKEMGQLFFYPPSVEGWTSGKPWLSAGALVERLKLAHLVGRTAPREAASVIFRRALDGEADPELKAMVARLPRVTHWSVVLGSPQFQLS